MHGLIFETSIWLLAGSTRLHLHTSSTELRSSVACAQPDLVNKISPWSPEAITRHFHPQLSNRHSLGMSNAWTSFLRLAICQANTYPVPPNPDMNNTSPYNLFLRFETKHCVRTCSCNPNGQQPQDNTSGLPVQSQQLLCLKAPGKVDNQ